MRWYKIIACDNTNKNPMVCGFDNIEENGFLEEDFITGKLITNWSNNVIFQATKIKDDGDPDDVLQNSQMLPIFSMRLIGKLNKLNINTIQYLPITVLRPNNSIVDGYFIANLLDIIEAFDLVKSTYNRFSQDFPNPNAKGKIAGVTKFVLKHDNLYNKEIIRLKEYNRGVFASERIQKLFELNKFTGYSFKEVEIN